MLRTIKPLLITTTLALSIGAATPVMACPSCKNANETDTLRPRAYMLSILFMLGMPATVFTGFGVAFYRMARRSPEDAAALEEYLQQHALQNPQQSSTTPPPTP
ncbi:MAG: hypothetical protein ACKO2P_02640 [Planctomycetota bacterium]